MTPNRAPAPGRAWLIAAIAIGCLPPFITWIDRAGEAGPLQYKIFTRLFFFDDRVTAIAVELAFLGFLLLPGVPAAVSRAVAWLGERPGAVVGAAFVVLALASRGVYLGHPLSMDEYAPFLQAQAFARGEMAVHYPPALMNDLIDPGMQGYFLMVSPRGEVMSAYWPGLALLATPFAALHAPWALNPALSALALWLVGDFAHRAGGPVARGWALAAALASPQFTANAISFYAMPGLLALNLLYLWLLLRPAWGYAILAGIVGSVALVLHNPVPHALMAVPCLVWLALDRTRWPRLAGVLAGYLPLGVLLGLGWPSYEAHLGMVRQGAPIILPPGSGILDEWRVRVHRIFGAPTDDTLVARWYATLKVWVWACPGLLLAVLAIGRRDAVQWVLAAALVLTYVAYYFVPFDQGHGWGYRYIHPVWGALPIAAGIWWARAGTGSEVRRLAAASVLAGLAVTPLVAWQIHGHVADSLAQRIEPPGEGRWVVFVAWKAGMYTNDVVQNYPGEDRVLYLISHGAARDRALVARQFPGAQPVTIDQRGSAWRLPDPVRSAAGSAGTS